MGYVEREAYAAAVLVARMDDETLDRAPIWDDLKTFDGRPWRGRVDLVAGGFPCQPFSVAGKRRGTEDARWLWPDIARIVEEVEPSVVFLENVPGLIRSGLHHVLKDLARLGFDAEWDRFRASDVGAPHRRERVFILAHREGELSRGTGGGITASDNRLEMADPEGRDGSLLLLEREPRPAGAESRGHGETLADAPNDHGRRRERGAQEGTRPRGERRRGSSGGGDTMGNAASDNQQRDRFTEPSGEKPTGRSIGLFPPGPADREAWAAILSERPDLAPAVEPAVRGVANGMAHRADRLHLCGNGVVPVVAAVAFRTLAARADCGSVEKVRR